MGERAIAVCWRADDSVDIYRSQWAGRDSTVAGVRSAVDPLDALCTAEWEHGGRVPVDRWVDAVAFLCLDAVFVVSPRGVSVWLPLWFGLPLVDGPVDSTFGALVRVETAVDRRRLRQEFRANKGLVQDGIDCGLLSVKGAIALLGWSLASKEVLVSESLLKWLPTTTV